MTELLSLNVYLFPLNGWQYMYLLIVGIFMYMLVAMVCRFIIFFSSLLLQISVLSIEIVDN